MPNSLRIPTLGVALAALLAAQAPLAAQSPKPIEADRPDFTEASSTVAPGRFQLEAGYTLRSAGKGIASDHSFPETLLRIGVASLVELRVSQNISATDGRTDFEDVVLGAKIGLGSEQGARPQLALLVQSSLATGKDRVSAGVAVPSASLLASWSLPDEWSLGASAIGTREADRHTSLSGSVVVGRPIAEGWRFFAEWFTTQEIKGASRDHFVNGGLTRSLSPLLQLDARVGAGLGGAADSYFFGFGVAVGW